METVSLTYEKFIAQFPNVPHKPVTKQGKALAKKEAKETKEMNEKMSNLRKLLATRNYIKKETKTIGEEVYKAFYDQFSEFSMQIASYEDFVMNGISHVMAVTSRMRIVCTDGEVEAYMHSPFLMQPGFIDDGEFHPTTPNECRCRKMSYVAPLYVDVVIKRIPHEGKPEEVTLSRKKLCDVPIMVKSRYCVSSKEDPYTIRECSLDRGGYFVINGIEKAIIGQEKLLMNVPYVFVGNGKIKCDFFGELRSQLSNDTQSVVHVLMMPKMLFVVQSIMFTKELPLAIVMQVFGIDYDMFCEIVKKNWKNEEHRYTMELMLERNREYTHSYNAEASECYIRSHLVKTVTFDEFVRDFMPHIGNTALIEKGEMLCYIVQQIMLVYLGISRPSNRDDYGNKRVEAPGKLLQQLFRRNFARLCGDVEKGYSGKVGLRKTEATVKKVNMAQVTIVDKFKDSITKAILYSLSTGNWNIPGSAESITGVGVAQIMTRYSFQRNLSMLSVPTNKSGKQTAQRSLHGSSFGMICPAETPEGAGCGLAKNLSLVSMISVDHSDAPLLKYIDVETIESRSDGAYVFINGKLIGVSTNPEKVVRDLRKLRRKCVISSFTSIVYNQQTNVLCVRTDAGRICYPLLVVEKNKVLITRKHLKLASRTDLPFNYFLENGLVEIIDAAEQHTVLVAPKMSDLENTKANYEYCLIDPALILGRAASNVPFADHDQSPRVVYQSAMGKQASGIPSLAFQYRIDNETNINNAPQRPLVSNNYCDMIGFNEAPPLQNVNLLVSSCASNQEDSIIISKGFIERGGGRITMYHSYIKESKTMGIGQVKRATYLDEDGLPEVGQILNNGDIVIGELAQKDCVTVKTILPQRVERVLLSQNANGVLAVVVVSETRIPVVGDKFAARHGQKGVLSLVMPFEDLPVDPITGETPDLIINAQAFPSRMTVAMFLEAVLGAMACELGMFIDATPFREVDFRQIQSDYLKLRLARMGVDLDHTVEVAGEKMTILESLDIPFNREDIPSFIKQLGYMGCGDRILIDGKTGQQLRGKGFMCPFGYQRLKHMVFGKIQGRGHGKHQVLTRQPVEGRAQEGGLRIGEMERDCMISYGGSALLLERLMKQSDQFNTDLCPQCGLMSTMIKLNDYQVCRKCTVDADPVCTDCKVVTKLVCKMCNVGVVPITVPYICKLLFQELMAMNVVPHIELLRRLATKTKMIKN